MDKNIRKTGHCLWAVYISTDGTLLLWPEYGSARGEHTEKLVQRHQQQNLISSKIISLKVQKSFVPHFEDYICLGFKGFFKHVVKQ